MRRYWPRSECSCLHRADAFALVWLLRPCFGYMITVVTTMAGGNRAYVRKLLILWLLFRHMHSCRLRGWVGGVWVLWPPLLRHILLHSMAVVVLCSGSGSGSGHPRDQFKLFRDKRPQITSTLIVPLFSLSGARIYMSKNWLTSFFKGSFFNWASLREPLVSSLSFFFLKWRVSITQKISYIVM